MSSNDPAQVSLLSGDSTKYCMDANVFYDFWIPGRKFDLRVYSKLWEYISYQISSGAITSTEEVYRELKDYDNPKFKTWLTDHKDHLYTENDQKVITLATKIINKNPKILFHKDKKNGADPFLVATAKVYNLTVITEEVPESSANLKSGACPKIPNMCEDVGVPSVNLLEYCANEGISLGPLT